MENRLGRKKGAAADLHFKEGRVRWKKGSESLFARLEVQLFVSWSQCDTQCDSGHR